METNFLSSCPSRNNFYFVLKSLFVWVQNSRLEINFLCRTWWHHVLYNFIIIAFEKFDVHLFLLPLKLNYRTFISLWIFFFTPSLIPYFYLLFHQYVLSQIPLTCCHISFQYFMGFLYMKNSDFLLALKMFCIIRMIIFSIHSPSRYTLR